MAIKATIFIILASAAFALILGVSGVRSAEPAKMLVWTQSYLNSFNASAVGGESDGYLAGDEGRLKHTNDRGRTWTTRETPAESSIVAVFAGDRGQVLIATRSDIWASFDRGSSWPLHLPVGEGNDFKSASFAPGDADTVWLVFTQTGNGWRGSRGSVTTQVSFDRGQSWQPARPAPVVDPLIVTDRAVAWAREGDNIFLTVNSGESWRQLAKIPIPPGDWIVDTKAYQSGLLLSSKRDNLFSVSPDGTVTNLPSVGPEYLSDIFPASDGSAHAVADPMYLWHTDSIEGGKWQQEGHLTTAFTIIRAWPDGTYLVGAQGGSYSVLPPPWDTLASIFKAPGLPTLVAVTDDDDRAIIATDQNTLLYTKDRGANWTASKQIKGGVVTALAMSGTGVAVALPEDGTILLSQDAGETWAECERIDSSEYGVLASVSRRGFAIIESSLGREPTQRYILRRVDLRSCKVDVLGRDEAFILMSEMPDGSIRALSDRGDFLHSDDGLTWERTASLPPLIAPVRVKSMWWLDLQRGWIVGDDGLYLATIDGATFTQGALLPRPGTSTPGHRILDQHPDLTAVWFADVRNGFVYGTYSEEGQVGDYHAVTSDGGRTWTSQDAIGMAESGSIAMGRANHGILLNTSGLAYVTGAIETPALSGVGSETLNGSFTFSIRSSSDILDLAEGADAVQLVVESGGVFWRVRPDAASNDAGKLDMQWSPSSDQNGIPVQPGANLRVTALIQGTGGVVSTVLFADQTYLGWWVKYRDFIQPTIVLLTLLAAFAFAVGLLFAFAPLALLPLNNAMTWLCELVAAIPFFGTVSPIIKVLSLGLIVERLAVSERTARQWCRAYARGKTHFSSLTPSTRARYLKMPMVIDAWVTRRFEEVCAHLEQRRDALGVASYIPMPVTVSVNRENGESMSRVDAKIFRPLFKAERVALGVIGDGGIGKTTLACQIGLWLMRGGRSGRIVRDHATLAVLLYGNIGSVLDAVRGELNLAFLDRDEMGTSDDILKAALELRRLCVIFDGLSEMTKESQDHVESVFSAGNSFRLLVYTARRPYRSILGQPIEVAPEQVTLATVNHFVSQYLHEVGLPADARPEEGPEIAHKVIELVRHRFGGAVIPQAFVVLFVDIIRLTRAALEALPVTLPSTVQSYVQNIKLGGESEVSQDVILRAATVLATVSLGEELVPREFTLEKARVRLKDELPEADVDIILRALLTTRLLVDRMSATGKMLSFRLDPIAEYLAAAQSVRSITSIEAWEGYYAKVQSMTGAVGFERSLVETVVASSMDGDWQSIVRDQLMQGASAKAGSAHTVGVL